MIPVLLCVLFCAAAFLLPQRKSSAALGETVPDVYRVTTQLLVSRLALLLFAYLVLINRFSSFSQVLDWLKGCGDVPHFLYLAQHGYSVGDANENLIVFYPLFPLLIRLVQLAVRDYYLSAFLLSNVCSVIGGVYLYKLFCLDAPGEKAKRAVLLLFAYPFAFFTLFAYTEGLFIMLCALSAYCARKGNWLGSGLWGLFAALCRTQGVLIFGFALYEFLLQTKEQAGDKGFFHALRLKGLFLLLIPCGLGMYLGLNAYLFGNPLQFLQFQAAAPWFNGAAFFANNLVQHFDFAKAYYPGLSWIIYIPQLVLFFLTFGLVFYGLKKKIRTSYLLHIAAYSLVSYTSSWLISGPRYMLSCVFLFLPMAFLADNKWLRGLLYTLSGGLFIFYFVLYLNGHAIM